MRSRCDRWQRARWVVGSRDRRSVGTAQLCPVPPTGITRQAGDVCPTHRGVSISLSIPDDFLTAAWYKGPRMESSEAATAQLVRAKLGRRPVLDS